jgi:hypothetical protein
MDATNFDIVSTFKSSGLTQDAFCRENGITLERLRYYLYKKKGCKNGPKTRTRRQKSSSPAFISFNQAEKTISKIDEGIKTIPLYMVSSLAGTLLHLLETWLRHHAELRILTSSSSLSMALR